MSRRTPPYRAGYYYHLYNRGASKGLIFFEDDHYALLLRRITRYSQRFSISVLCYCLMPNHYHFLVQQNSERSVSRFMQRTFNSYSKAVNAQQGRSGTLFEGPYRAKHIDSLEYLVHLCRYIHRNPLEAGMVKKIRDWPWSDYPDCIGERSGGFISPGFTERYFSSPEEYRAFVHAYASPPKIDRFLFSN